MVIYEGNTTIIILARCFWHECIQSIHKLDRYKLRIIGPIRWRVYVIYNHVIQKLWVNSVFPHVVPVSMRESPESFKDGYLTGNRYWKLKCVLYLERCVLQGLEEPDGFIMKGIKPLVVGYDRAVLFPTNLIVGSELITYIEFGNFVSLPSECCFLRRNWLILRWKGEVIPIILFWFSSMPLMALT